MDSVVHDCENLTESDIVYLKALEGRLGILADLSRADVLVFCPRSADQAVVVSQAKPHSILPIYDHSLLGREASAAEEPAVLRALELGRRGFLQFRRGNGQRPSPIQGAPIVQETYPIRRRGGPVIAALCIETNLIERERHRRRSKMFQRALRQLRQTVLISEMQGVEQLTPFGEHDGVMVIDQQHRIQYISGIATSLYRNLGYTGNLLKRYIEDLDFDNSTPVLTSLMTGECLEETQQIGDFVWVKKTIPLCSATGGLRRLGRGSSPLRQEGVIVTMRDETESRRQEEELRVKVAMIQEIHHRVKNNLQTIASLLRLQSRRSDSEQVQRALSDGISRILSVAVIHEFLAHHEARAINIRDVSQRIIDQIREGVMDKEKGIRLGLRGPNIYLPTQPATVCALVINELLQNALEHGYERQDGGTVTVNLGDDGDLITISVDDDGGGLPKEFDLAQTSSLGLQIVRTLAEGDLKGEFELRSRDKGVSAVVTFPKHSQGGR